MEKQTREARKSLYLSEREAEALEVAARKTGMNFGTWARVELLKIAESKGKGA